VTLLGPEAKVTETKAETGFVAGLKHGWHVFVSSVNVVLTLIGALLPFVIVIGVPLYLVLRITRRRRLVHLVPVSGDDRTPAEPDSPAE